MARVMKIFQVEAGICHWDATNQFPTLQDTVGFFPPDVLFVEAPDNVFEGWGYLNGKFIQPEPPEGWLYDENTGTFYPPNLAPEPPTAQERLEAQVTYTAMMTDTLLEEG